MLLAIAQTLVWACIYYSFPALLLHWEAALGWSRADLTAAITLALVVSAMASPFSGRLIDKGQGPLMMTMASLIAGVCLGLLAMVEHRWQFYALWASIGFCMSGCLYEPCFALITRARRGDAKHAIIVVTLIAGFAGSISFPTVHSLVASIGWRLTLVVFALVTILLVTPLMWCGAKAMEATSRAQARDEVKTQQGEASFWASSVFWLLAFAFSFSALVHGVTLHHLLPILDDRSIDPQLAVIVVASIGPMQVVGRIVMMLSERHVSNHRVAMSCFAIMGASMLVLILAKSTPMLLVLFVILFGAAYGMVSIIRPVIARELLGETQFGAKSGGLAVFYLIGSASAPFLGALVWSRGGYDSVLPGLLLLAAIGLGLYCLAAWRSQLGLHFS